tara:strand:- start:203 stop:430 length:228 start_codon:yes stop_codon:yes gene_type:complete
MKLKKLEVGEIYKCKLSDRKVLIVMTEAQNVKDEKGNDVSIPEQKVGKMLVQIETGDFKYSLIALHDGQLEEINS